MKFSLINKWPVEYLPISYHFGKGYTIMTRLFPLGGREIHVMSSVPVRKIAAEIMNSIGGEWWTTIDERNIKAINVAKKCGFKLIQSINVSMSATGERAIIDLYRREL